MVDKNAQFRALPAVHVLLAHPAVQALRESQPAADLKQACHDVLDAARERIRNGEDAGSLDRLVGEVVGGARALGRAGMHRVVNATGIVLHTGLGRAVLAEEAIDALVQEASGYCLLAVDAETAGRGRRERHVEALLKRLTGAPAATVVNNNAAATMLALDTLARGKEAIVSRGQLVEIGGSYRIPDVMRRAGCHMVEVGCTNRTHLRDYREAITENTGAIVRVHPSNFRIEGFEKSVPLEELVELGREYGIPVIDDLGSGALVPLGTGHDEPLVSASIEAGATLVTCSADKLIGGPQGGILLGSPKEVRDCELNQISRTLRVGKLDLIALEATLRLFLDPEELLKRHPTSRMLTRSAADLEPAAQALAEAVGEGVAWARPEVVDGESYAGSGALPARPIPSRVVRTPPPPGMGASEASRRLRTGAISLWIRVSDESLILDPRTLQEGEVASVVDALAALA